MDLDSMDRRAREAYWREQIAACADSGLSGARYCAAAGIPVVRYYWWKRRVQILDGASPLFTELRVASPAPPPSAPSVEIALGDHRVVRVHTGFDPATLAQVVRVLESL